MSDQDFFFDEDEAPKESTPAKGAGKQSAAKSGSAKPAAAAAPVAAGTVTTTVAALIGVIALLAGVIIGVVLPVGGDQVPAPTPGQQAPSGMGGGGGSAPQLSPEDLENGALPEGHPPIDGMGGGEGAPGGGQGAPDGGSEETTPN